MKIGVPLCLGPIAKTVPVAIERGMLNLDFDADGHLVGVEMIPASLYLPSSSGSMADGLNAGVSRSSVLNLQGGVRWRRSLDSRERCIARGFWYCFNVLGLLDRALPQSSTRASVPVAEAMDATEPAIDGGVRPGFRLRIGGPRRSRWVADMIPIAAGRNAECMNRCRLLGQLERGFLEFTFGHYPTPNRYPMVAARLVAAGEVGSRLAELAGLSENAPESEIRELLMAIGEDFAWTPETHSSGVRRLFAFWACAVGSELDAAEFARRSRIGIVRENFALPSYDWVEWLVGLESEWDEINRPRDVVEADIAVFAQELCAEEGLAGGCTCTDLG